MHNSRKFIIASLQRRYDGTYHWVFTYYTRNELISRIARQPDILDHLSKDMSETELKSKLVYYIGKIKNKSIIKIDLFKLVDDINLKIELVQKKRDIRRLKYSYKDRQRESYTFRRDPVPYIHNYNNCHRGSYYRIPQLRSQREYNSYNDIDIEYQSYIRPKTKIQDLPKWSDDIVRHSDKSWKTSCKVKKQYMKHLDKHIDTFEIIKRNYLEETDHEE